MRRCVYFAVILITFYVFSPPLYHFPSPLPPSPHMLLCRFFTSVRTVLQGACHMVAMQIACEPLVRQTLRQVFQSRAVICTKPTKKGRKVVALKAFVLLSHPPLQLVLSFPPSLLPSSPPPLLPPPPFLLPSFSLSPSLLLPFSSSLPPILHFTLFPPLMLLSSLLPSSPPPITANR